jgi:peptidoglycan/LPS O-acetylase OafA/YrhL
MNESVSPPIIKSVSEGRPGTNLEIEYLRAVAVLLVVFVHVNVLFPGLGLGQWTGVDLFFCISGYVICRSYEQFFDKQVDQDRWGSAAWAFWVRRIFRLAPAAWLWLAVNVICAWKFNSSGWFGTIENSLNTALYFLTLVTNFALAHGNVGSNGYFWSLTLEDQFYIVFPFFLLLVRGRWRWKIFLLLIFLQAIPDRSLPATGFPSYLWMTRTDALLWGCLIYQFSRSKTYWKLEPTIFRYRIVAFVAAAALLYCLIEIPKGAFGFIVGHKIETFVALTSAGLVLLASYDRGYILPLPKLLSAALEWIGSRSYGIYLIHLPLFGIVQELWLRYSHFLGAHPPDPRYFYAPMILILLPILAELNFRFVESPLRRRGTQLANRIMAKRPAMPTALPDGILELGSTGARGLAVARWFARVDAPEYARSGQTRIRLRRADGARGP